MKSKGLIAALTAALMLAGCGSSGQLIIKNVDSEGNEITSAVPGAVTEAAVTAPAEMTTTAPSVTAPAESAADDSSETPSTGDAELDKIIAAVAGIGSDGSPSAFGTKAPSQTAIDAVKKELDQLTASGHKVSFVILDLASMSGLSYNSGTAFCAQSAIKAPYAASLVESDPSLLTSRYNDIYETVTNSLNANYRSLRNDYGFECLKKWCTETGAAESIAAAEYPVMTVKDMLKLWAKIYRYFNSSEEGKKLANFYVHSIGSAGALAYAGKLVVHSKAGWECGQGDVSSYDPNFVIPAYLKDGSPYNDECSCNDAGIIHTSAGDKLYVIFSDIPYGVFQQNTPANPLTGLIQAMVNSVS